MGNKLTGSNKAAAFVSLALAACAAALYARTFSYYFVWDDLLYLEGFQQYQGVAGAVRAVVEPFLFYPGYYRPAVMLSFVVSAEPAVQHGINVALHALNTALVFWCARALMPREVAASRSGVAAAALGALVFALHPVAVEPVAWVSGRFDTLMCSFVLGTCLAALGGELTRRRLTLACVLFFAAMCSKEAAIGLPVAMPMLLLLKWRLTGEETGVRERVRRLASPLAALALGAALYIAARLAVMQRLLFAAEEMGVTVTFSGGSVLDKLNVAALAVTAFAKLLVNPWSHSAPLHPYSYEADSGVLPQTMVVLAVVLVLFVLAALKKPRLNFPLALLSALAMLWPALHLIGIPNGENIISDRYALTPLALLAAELAAAVSAWAGRRVPVMEAGERRVLAYAWVFGLLWAGALAAYTNLTIPMWRNEMVLWDFAHRQVPASSVAYSNFIRVLMSQGRWGEAIAEAKKYLHTFPERALSPSLADLDSFMLLRAKTGDYKGAIELFEAFEKGVAEQGDMRHEVGGVYRTRAVIEGEAGNWGEALRWHEKAVQISPADVRSAFRYAEALFMNGLPEKAEEVFSRALAGSTKELAEDALEWRKGWRLPAEAAEGAGQGASASASAADSASAPAP